MSDSSSRKGGFIGQAWLVILLALLYGVGLAAVQTFLGGRIAENKKNETYKVIPDLVPGADKTKTVEQVLSGTDGKDYRVYQAFSSEGTHIGWVIPTTGQGFADIIDMLIGVDAKANTLTGIYVLDQKETPGLGDYITGKEFRDRFIGKSTERPLNAVKDDPQKPEEVRALSGATISSLSVCEIVNAALAKLKDALRNAPDASASGTAN